MKQVLIFAAAGFMVFQTVLILAILAAAARPTPVFKPAPPKTAELRKEEEELELVS